VSIEEPSLPSNLMAVALEFFLQMDGNCDCFRLSLSSEVIVYDSGCFFMKTCSYRGAEPRSSSEGLFCVDDEPNER